MKNNNLLFLSFCLFGLIFLNILACKSAESQNKDAPTGIQAKMEMLHYYSVKQVNNRPEKDSLMGCFSCNQGVVFDATGKEIERRFYKSNMEDMFSYEIFKHNAKGQKIGSDYYENDTLITAYEYELDDLGRIIEGLAFDINTGNLRYGYINEYDSLGNHISTGTMDSKGAIYEYYVRQFNENGIAMFENITDLKKQPTFNVKYEYRTKADSTWTEQLTYYNGKLKEIRFKETILLENL